MARGRRRRKDAPPEKALPGDSHFSSLYESQVKSAAFRDLTDKQARLLLLCNLETHGRAQRDSDDNDPLLFYMNYGLYVTHYGLYGAGNERGFRRDMAALIEHGFVNCLENGYEKRGKSLYRLSSRWWLWGEPSFSMPEEYMTVHMLRERAKRLKTG